ncbi:MAG: hypothetical protein AAF628_27225 [Planctomycetota bacterium]
MDLSQNERLYQRTEYRVSVPAERAAFLGPVMDGRRAAEASGRISQHVLSDASWAQLPSVMLDAIVRDELATSGVFAELRPRLTPDTCLVEVAFDRFDAAVREQPSGRQGLGGVALQVKVHGVEVAGERPLLLERTYAEEIASEVALQPPNPRILLGLALRRAMLRMLAELDQTSVGRTQAAAAPVDPR